MGDCAFLPALGLQVCYVSRQLNDILYSSPRVASPESRNEQNGFQNAMTASLALSSLKDQS